MARRTKIIATIGPASESPQVLEGLIDAGMDIARIGLAHNDLQTSIDRYERVRKAAEKKRKNTGILVDLPGPKIRTAPFKGGGCDFSWGEKVTLRYGKSASSANAIEVDYEDLATSIQEGDQIGFGDGSVFLQVESVKNEDLECTVLHGGTLVGRPGVSIPAERVSLPTPTPDDLKKLDAFMELGVNLVALSFVRSAQDIKNLNLDPSPAGPLVVAKIETHLAVEQLSEIVKAAGAVMVARGDLGTQYPLEEVPHLQKQIIQECIAYGRPVITATQMLESMIHSPTPTRAEVSDIANAVYDGSSAVMLSAETAVGNNPVRVVETMARVAEKADDNFNTDNWIESMARQGMSAMPEGKSLVTHAITMAGARVAGELDLAAIICISGSGLTVRSTARFRPKVPILGFSVNPRVVSQLSISWGVKSFLAEEAGSYEARIDEAIKLASREGLVKSGDLVAVLAGLTLNAGATDVLRLMRIE